MASAWESGGATNYKKQKQEFQTKKTEQLFNFFLKAFKDASNEAKLENLKPANNKRKNEENFAFDEDLFDSFELDSNNNDKNE